MNSGLTSHQQRGHTETGPRFKVSSERPEKRGIDLATPGLVVQRVIHYTTAAPISIGAWQGRVCVWWGGGGGGRVEKERKDRKGM